jgi:cytoskeletal protein CcmA (bactofilin family)
MKKIFTAFLLAWLLIAPASPVLANGGEGVVIFGKDFTLESGEELGGDLVVFGGDVTLEEDSSVGGTVFIVGGSATVVGEVNGDLVVFGGDVELKSTASIGGDVVAWGGQVERAEGAVVKGNVSEGVTTRFFQGPRIVRVVPFPPTSGMVPFEAGSRFFFNTMMGIFKAIITALALMALGLLVILFLPKQTETVAQAVLAAPLPSLGVGFLTAVVAVALTTLLAITICLSPIALFIGLVTTAAGFFGWIAVGLLVGQKLLEGLKAQEPAPLVAVVIGVLLISLISALPCLGFLVFLGVVSLGLGGVVLTRFGTMSYPERPLSSTSLVPAEPQPPAAAIETESQSET